MTIHYERTSGDLASGDDRLAYELAMARKDRRERIATAALQGLLAHSGSGSVQWVASYALDHADALIAELDKELTP